MNDVQAAEGGSAYPVYGEAAPPGLARALLALGGVMAAAAAWLVQAQPALGPGFEHRAPAPQVVAGRTAVEPARGGQPGAREIQAAKQALPASASLAPRSAKPLCPPALSIHFPVAKSVPEAGGLPAELADMVEWAQRHPAAKIAVEGHADAVGQDQSNLLLSYLRAKAVMAMLTERGLAPQRIQIAAAGSHALIEGLPGDAHANRRVTVRINDPDHCPAATP